MSNKNYAMIFVPASIFILAVMFLMEPTRELAHNIVFAVQIGFIVFAGGIAYYLWETKGILWLDIKIDNDVYLEGLKLWGLRVLGALVITVSVVLVAYTFPFIPGTEMREWFINNTGLHPQYGWEEQSAYPMYVGIAALVSSAVAWVILAAQENLYADIRREHQSRHRVTRSW
jgi:hypothetical protein